MNIKVTTAIKRHQMLHPGDTVLVALSGGADSMVLLRVLSSLKEQLGIELYAAHFNHGIRGEEAERDARFCAEVCEKMGVKLFTEKADIPALAAQKGIGLEECGRQERYAFFERIMPEAKVATAHTLSDCEETFLFNLARGSALKGLCSIPPVRGNVIRPLIDCSRTEIEKYCEENGIEYVTDSTNLSDEYTRNHLRHNAVPQLKKINPSFDSAFARCVESLRDDEALLESLTAKVLEQSKLDDGYKVNVLRDAHSSLKKRAVAAIIEELCGEKPSAVHIDAVCDLLQKGGNTQILGGVNLCVYNGLLKKQPQKIEPWEQNFALGISRFTLFSIKTELFDKNNKINIQKFNKELLANVIDYDKIKGALFWSSMREGDKIRPRGRGVTKQLRRIFNETGVEPAKRQGIPVLRDREGIVWVAGVGVDQRAAVDGSTESLLFLEVLENA